MVSRLRSRLVISALVFVLAGLSSRNGRVLCAPNSIGAGVPGCRLWEGDWEGAWEGATPALGGMGRPAAIPGRSGRGVAPSHAP